MVELTEAETKAKEALNASLKDLQKAAQGTSVMMGLPVHLLTIQVDVMCDQLVAAGVVQREVFWADIKSRVDALASECRKAVLASGGASAMAGLKRPI